MGRGKIGYKDWKTGENKEFFFPLYAGCNIHKTSLICPFDNIEILDAEYYHNEHETFCPGCGMKYLSRKDQKLINQEAIENAKDYIKDLSKTEESLKQLEVKKADLEARIKHAEEVGLIPKNN